MKNVFLLAIFMMVAALVVFFSFFTIMIVDGGLI